jgi:hypothetical protein
VKEPGRRDSAWRATARLVFAHDITRTTDAEPRKFLFFFDNRCKFFFDTCSESLDPKGSAPSVGRVEEQGCDLVAFFVASCQAASWFGFASLRPPSPLKMRRDTKARRRSMQPSSQAIRLSFICAGTREISLSMGCSCVRTQHSRKFRRQSRRQSARTNCFPTTPFLYLKAGVVGAN